MGWLSTVLALIFLCSVFWAMAYFGVAEEDDEFDLDNGFYDG